MHVEPRYHSLRLPRYDLQEAIKRGLQDSMLELIGGGDAVAGAKVCVCVCLLCAQGIASACDCRDAQPLAGQQVWSCTGADQVVLAGAALVQLPYERTRSTSRRASASDHPRGRR